MLKTTRLLLLLAILALPINANAGILFNKYIGSGLLVGAIALQNACTDEQGHIKAKCKLHAKRKADADVPEAADSGYTADHTVVSAPPSEIDSTDTTSPALPASTADQNGALPPEGMEAAPALEGAPGYEAAEAMTAEDLAIEKRASEILGDNLRRNGEYPTAHSNGGLNAAHHIVANKDLRSADSRRLLKEFDIDINSAENGVWLPHNDRQPESGLTYHGDTFGKEYFYYVNEKLKNVNSRQEALDALADIKQVLKTGGAPWKR